MILGTRVNKVNVVNQDQFACSTKFNIKEPETYAHTMQDSNAAKWVKTMEEELDQLEKNNTWEFVYYSQVIEHKVKNGSTK